MNDYDRKYTYITRCKDVIIGCSKNIPIWGSHWWLSKEGRFITESDMCMEIQGPQMILAIMFIDTNNRNGGDSYNIKRTSKYVGSNLFSLVNGREPIMYN